MSKLSQSQRIRLQRQKKAVSGRTAKPLAPNHQHRINVVTTRKRKRDATFSDPITNTSSQNGPLRKKARTVETIIDLVYFVGRSLNINQIVFFLVYKNNQYINKVSPNSPFRRYHYCPGISAKGIKCPGHIHTTTNPPYHTHSLQFGPVFSFEPCIDHAPTWDLHIVKRQVTQHLMCMFYYISKCSCA